MLETILLLSKENCFHDGVINLCNQYMKNNEFNTNNMIITSSLETVKYIVARRLGVSIIPTSAIRANDANLYLTKSFSEPQPSFEVLLAYRSNFNIEHIIRALVKITYHN